MILCHISLPKLRAKIWDSTYPIPSSRYGWVLSFFKMILTIFISTLFRSTINHHLLKSIIGDPTPSSMWFPANPTRKEGFNKGQLMTMVRFLITMHDTYKCIMIKYDLISGFEDFLVFGCCCNMFQTEPVRETSWGGSAFCWEQVWKKNDKLGWHAELRVLYDATTGSTNDGNFHQQKCPGNFLAPCHWWRVYVDITNIQHVTCIIFCGAVLYWDWRCGSLETAKETPQWLISNNRVEVYHDLLRSMNNFVW